MVWFLSGLLLLLLLAFGIRRSREALLGWMKSGLEWVGLTARSWVYAVIVTFALAVTGLLGSVYSEDVRSAFPLDCFESTSGPVTANGDELQVAARPGQPPEAESENDEALLPCGPYVGVSRGASVFWLTLFITGVLFGVRQWRRDSDASELADDLRSRTEELMEAIRTMPPADFLVNFGNVYDECERVAEVAFTAEDEEAADALRLALRVVLHGLAYLAKEFDAKGGRYAANIMVYVPSDQIPEEDLPRYQNLDYMPFRPAEAGVRAFKGVLVLRKDLSTVEEADAGPTEIPDTDKTLQDLAVPVPNERWALIGDSKRYRALPGAPMAFCYRRIDGFRDTSEINDWLDRKAALDPEVSDRVKGYFHEAEHIASFYSIPLSDQPDSDIRDDQGEEETADHLDDPIGVLNIHSDVPDMLSEPALNHFAAVTRPLRMMAFRLLDDLLAVEEGK